jgi:ABC-type transport system substrate-binding protein
VSRARRGSWLAPLILLVVAGCGTEPPGGSRTASATPPAVSSSAIVAVSDGWLAVIAAAADPSELDPLTQELLPIGGASFVVAPSRCFDGLPAAYADDGYVLGFLAEDRAVVDALVRRADRSALLFAHVRSRCTD